MKTMKTTKHQFDLLVTFMEKHGDLSKPVGTSKARRLVLEHWENLTYLLNGDSGGDPKTTEKWKKVWSDFKNNLKKKAARLHRTTATRCGPAFYAKLTDLERRVLKLVGLQPAAGLSIRKDLTTVELVEPVERKPQISQIDESVQLSNELAHSCQGRLERSQAYSEASSSVPVVFQIIVNSQEETTALQNRDSITPTLQHSDVALPDLTQPSSFGQTIPRCTASKHQPSRQKRRDPKKKIDQAARSFQRSDANWRLFKKQQHKDYMEMRREKNRIKKLEVQMQKEWQNVALRTLDLVERVVDKFCKD